MEAFGGAHRIDGGFHGFTAGQRQGLRDITDAQADERCVGIGAAERFDASTDLREQVARFELEVVAVDLNHGIGSYFCGASCRVGSSIR